MKKIFYVLLMMFLIIILHPVITSAAPKPVKTVTGSAINVGNIDGISISQTSSTIYIGASFNLSISGTNSYVMWKSSDKKVANVNKYGKVTGVGTGKANIVATIGAGKNSIKLSCQVVVKSRLSTDTINVICPEDEYQEINIYCDNLQNNEYLFYDVEDDKIADVESIDNGSGYSLRIIPQKNGSTTLTVYTGKSIDNLNERDTLVINIFVVDDKEWVNEGYLENLDLLDITYADFDYDSHIMSYKGNEISFKHENGYFIYLNVDDLKEAGIL